MMDSFEQELNDHTEIHIKLQFEECIEKRNQLANEFLNLAARMETHRKAKAGCKMLSGSFCILQVLSEPLFRIANILKHCLCKYLFRSASERIKRRQEQLEQLVKDVTKHGIVLFNTLWSKNKNVLAPEVLQFAMKLVVPIVTLDLNEKKQRSERELKEVLDLTEEDADLDPIFELVMSLYATFHQVFDGIKDWEETPDIIKTMTFISEKLKEDTKAIKGVESFLFTTQKGECS